MLHAIAPYWSYFLAGLGLIALWMTRKLNRWGWALGLFTQFLWIAYAVVTHQYGFLPGSVVTGFICVEGFRSWKDIPERQAEKSDQA